MRGAIPAAADHGSRGTGSFGAAPHFHLHFSRMRRTPHILSCATIFSPFESLAQVAVHSGWEFEDHDFISEALEGDWEKRVEEECDALRALANASLPCGEATERVEDDLDQRACLEVGVFDALDSADGEAAARGVDTPTSKLHHWTPWTPREDDVLCKKFAAHGPNWRKLAAYLPGRSAAATRKRWNRWVADPDSANSRRGGSSKGMGKRLWTPEEEARLEALVGENRAQKRQRGSVGYWAQIAAQLPGRSADSVSAHWCNRKTRPHPPREADESSRGCRWTPEEDAQLMTLHDKLAGNWRLMAAHLPRNRHASESRFYRLKTNAGEGRYGVNQEGAGRAWSPEEDVKLLHLAHQYGLNWERIATELTGRFSACVKFRWQRLMIGRLARA